MVFGPTKPCPNQRQGHRLLLRTMPQTRVTSLAQSPSPKKNVQQWNNTLHLSAGPASASASAGYCHLSSQALWEDTPRCVGYWTQSSAPDALPGSGFELNLDIPAIKSSLQETHMPPSDRRQNTPGDAQRTRKGHCTGPRGHPDELSGALGNDTGFSMIPHRCPSRSLRTLLDTSSMNATTIVWLSIFSQKTKMSGRITSSGRTATRPQHQTGKTITIGARGQPLHGPHLVVAAAAL